MQINLNKIKIKNLFLYLGWILFFVVLFSSCGAIKKHKESTEVETETNTNTEVKLDYQKDSFTLEPVDLTRPIFVGGKEYHNTIIRYEKEKGTEETTQKIEEKAEVKQEIKEKETDNTKLILGVFGIGFLFLFLIIIFIVIYFSNQIKSIIPR